MSEITRAIEARQAQITQLQSDIETLQRAASIVGGKGATAKATPQPKVKRKIKRRRRKRAAAKGSSGKPKTTQKRKPTWSAADSPRPHTNKP